MSDNRDNNVTASLSYSGLFINSFIFSTNFLLSACYISGRVPSAVDTVVTKIDKVSTLS